MTFDEQRFDLLAFLANVSHQLESLLNLNQEFAVVNPFNEREEHTLSSKEAPEASTTSNQQPSNSLNGFDANTATDISQPSQFFTRITDSQELSCLQREEERSHYQHRYNNNGLPQQQHLNQTTASTRIVVPNLVGVNQVGYANTAHHYVPSESANLVNYTQYSAKPPQRQDTGYIYRDDATNLRAMSQSQPFSLLPPSPTLQMQSAPQDYQPECAYCCWLATTAAATSNSQPQPILMGPISSTEIAHFVDPSNYAYQGG